MIETPWTESAQLASPRSIVMIDDANSSSEEHILSHIDFSLPVRAFSYRGKNRRYNCSHAWMKGLAQQAKHVSDTYIGTQPNREISLIGFGVGAPIALFGVEYYIQQRAELALKDKIHSRLPRVILLCPLGISSLRQDLEAMIAYCENFSQSKDNNSPIIQDVEGTSFPMLDFSSRIISAMKVLFLKNIECHVIMLEDKIFCGIESQHLPESVIQHIVPIKRPELRTLYTQLVHIESIHNCLNSIV